jgi:hypothetical protein
MPSSRWIKFVLPALLGLACLTPSAQAQQRRGPARPPTVSPFISLGTGGGLNYYNIVRPSLETRALLNRQEAEVRKLEQRNQQKESATGELFEFTLPRTGHRAYFSTYSHYYGSRR